ncbi:hypothetical protein HDU77_000472, partial [Chytriomyces hyalinus]
NRLSLLESNFQASLSTQALSSIPTMLSAVQAIINTALHVGNQHAITTWKYAESLLHEATDQSLSAKGTMCHLAEYLGAETTSYEIPCSLIKTLRDEAKAELKHATAVSDACKDSRKASY